jgi:osmotically-inducible protein OsmY
MSNNMKGKVVREPRTQTQSQTQSQGMTTYHQRNYSKDYQTLENINNAKYSETGESEYSREHTIPFDWNDYHMNQNLSYSMSSERKKNHVGKGPKGYKRADERIYDDVCDLLFRCPEVDATEIEVSVKEGEVKLQGNVDTRQTKKKAELLIENISGVVDVHNELIIGLAEKGGTYE